MAICELLIWTDHRVAVVGAEDDDVNRRGVIGYANTTRLRSILSKRTGLQKLLKVKRIGGGKEGHRGHGLVAVGVTRRSGA